MNIYELMMNELRAGGDKVAVSEDIVKQCNKAIEDWEKEQEKLKLEQVCDQAVDKIVDGMNEYLRVKYGEEWALVDKEIVMEALEGVYGVLANFGKVIKTTDEAITVDKAIGAEEANTVVKNKRNTMSPEDVESIISNWIKILA